MAVLENKIGAGKKGVLEGIAMGLIDLFRKKKVELTEEQRK